MGTKGASVDEVVEVDERGWLVTVADRFGKYDDKGFGSTGESVGVVAGEPKLRCEKESSESSGDRKDDEDDAE